MNKNDSLEFDSHQAWRRVVDPIESTEAANPAPRQDASAASKRVIWADLSDDERVALQIAVEGDDRDLTDDECWMLETRGFLVQIGGQWEVTDKGYHCYNHAREDYAERKAGQPASEPSAASDCEYHELSAERTLQIIVEALDDYALMDYIEACGAMDEDDRIGWTLLQAAMCRAREIARATAQAKGE